MPNSQIDIASLLRGQVSIKPEEHDDDRKVRLAAQARKDKINDYLRVVTFGAMLAGLIATVCVTGYEGIISTKATPEIQHWCQNVLSAVATGGISYVLGKNSKTRDYND